MASIIKSMKRGNKTLMESPAVYACTGFDPDTRRPTYRVVVNGATFRDNMELQLSDAEMLRITTEWLNAYRRETVGWDKERERLLSRIAELENMRTHITEPDAPNLKRTT